MPRRQSESFDLYRLPISRDALKKLPDKTRRVYLLAGHIANELNELHRLAAITLDQELGPTLNLVMIGRAWVILRVLIGKTFEAFRFIEDKLKDTGEFYQNYLREPLSDPTKHPYIGAEQRGSYAKVWTRIDAKRGLLKAIRNDFGFHYELRPYLDEGFDGLDESWDLSVYSAGTPRHHSRHASFHAASEHVIVRAMLAKVVAMAGASVVGDAAQDGAATEASEPDLVKAMAQLADETLDAVGEIADFMETLMVCIMERHSLLDGQVGELVMPLNGVPSIRKFRIPPILKT
jgi:hypothetical protein